jgi:hypothetical protein
MSNRNRSTKLSPLVCPTTWVAPLDCSGKPFIVWQSLCFNVVSPFESEADLLIEAKEWGQAEERLQQAVDLQDKLNREYRGTNQASVLRLEDLRVKLVGIRSGQSYMEVQRVVELADERRAASENLEAAVLYQEAARLQRQLNEDYQGQP